MCGAPCSILLAGSQLGDQLPALPQRQLELAQIALGNIFAGLHGAKQVVERVPFIFEVLCAVFETARRKECGQALRRWGLLSASLFFCDFFLLSVKACSRSHAGR
eukprot:scaffold1507_cov53-Phaeocystis_antarctica.AAC.2